MAAFCEQFTFKTSSRHGLRAGLFLDVSVFIKLFWRVCGFKIFSTVILCPRRHDRRGPIVCVSHSARQNSLVDCLLHVGQTKMGRNHFAPISVTAKFVFAWLLLAFFPSLSPQEIFQCHFWTARVTKTICRRNSWLLNLFTLLQNLFKDFPGGASG